MPMSDLLPCMPYRRAFLRAIAGGVLLAFGAACAGDETGPSTETVISPDSPGSTTVNPSLSALPGIVFSSSDMPKDMLGSVHTGSLVGGALSPTNMLSLLSNARARKARYVIKLCMGSDKWVKNADGTFSFTKWKALVDRFKAVNFATYIADGTVLGHYLIDEPSRASKWGGKVISQAQVEAMAAYSKKIWPGMPTLVRVVPSWLAQGSVTYTHLDAGWFQYASRFGDPAKALAAEVAVAKTKGLGLVVGMNVLDGGNGSSKIAGWSSGKWKMSATEVKTYGLALLSNSYVCGFNMWMWDPTYYGRSDIKSAMTALSTKAKAHARTSCRV